ncbi:MAG TPA: L-2-amino-thiazoline-4-carboxylic acid hydrolase [Patescibacteria group bacterium]|nr:L-2-amino-thiazoline-4-carboxylic acid hydrolase [Patescibacteria group bacterium]
MRSITRREFLKHAALTALVVLPCGMVVRKMALATPAEAASNYYLQHRPLFLEEFRNVLQGAAQFLKPEYGEQQTQNIVRQALEHFGQQLPAMPEVGGDKNWDTPFLLSAAWTVALYNALRSRGKTAEEVSKLIYELNRHELENLPEATVQAAREKMFSPAGLQELREWADWTQKREFRENWVAAFVEGDGQGFDYGIEYTECALVKYFQAQGVPELAPYICQNDFLKSRVYGSGLERTQTIARGDGHCNFRYKQGRPVLQDWDTERKYIQS